MKRWQLEGITFVALLFSVVVLFAWRVRESVNVRLADVADEQPEAAAVATTWSGAQSVVIIRADGNGRGGQPACDALVDWIARHPGCEVVDFEVVENSYAPTGHGDVVILYRKPK